jgi:hypothetical protein
VPQLQSEDAYRTAVEHVNQDLDAFVQDISQIAQSCSSYSSFVADSLMKFVDIPSGIRYRSLRSSIAILPQNVQLGVNTFFASVIPPEWIQELQAFLIPSVSSETLT